MAKHAMSFVLAILAALWLPGVVYADRVERRTRTSGESGDVAINTMGIASELGNATFNGNVMPWHHKESAVVRPHRFQHVSIADMNATIVGNTSGNMTNGSGFLQISINDTKPSVLGYKTPTLTRDPTVKIVAKKKRQERKEVTDNRKRLNEALPKLLLDGERGENSLGNETPTQVVTPPPKLPDGLDLQLATQMVLKRIIGVRHGESVGNIVSYSMKKNKGHKLSQTADALRLVKDVIKKGARPTWAGRGAVRDSSLSTRGLSAMQKVGRALFGQERDTDTWELFSEDNLKDGVTVLFSPLKRAISTTIEMFGIPVQNMKMFEGKEYPNRPHFKAEPLAHERLHTYSDFGSSSDTLVKYVAASWSWKNWWFRGTDVGYIAKEMQESIKGMRTKQGLEWYANPKYYEDTEGLEAESGVFFERRMQDLVKSISEEKSKTIILVAHGKVLSRLFAEFFKRENIKEGKEMKPANGCVLVGEFMIWPDGKGTFHETDWEMIFNDTRQQSPDPAFDESTVSRRFPFSRIYGRTDMLPYLMEALPKKKKEKDVKRGVEDVGNPKPGKPLTIPAIPARDPVGGPSNMLLADVKSDVEVDGGLQKSEPLPEPPANPDGNQVDP